LSRVGPSGHSQQAGEQDKPERPRSITRKEMRNRFFQIFPD
jgi:hypothetical protein